MMKRHLLALCALGSVLAACADGYPTEDTRQPDPFSLTAEQRVAELNQLGASAHADFRGHYRLIDGCRLQVERKIGRGAWESSEHALAQVQPELANGTDGKSYDVLLATAQADETALLLRTERRLDAQHARLLVRLLKGDCAATSGAVPPDGPR